jgi:hypothetical protein
MLHRLGIERQDYAGDLAAQWRAYYTSCIYQKTMPESRIDAMETLHATLQKDLTFNDLSTRQATLVN